MLDTPPSHMIPHRLCRIRYQNKYDTASYARLYQAVMTADKQTTQSDCRDVDGVSNSTCTFIIITSDGTDNLNGSVSDCLQQSSTDGKPGHDFPVHR